MEVINIPNNTNNLSGDAQREINRKTAANFLEISESLGGSSFVSRIITSFLISENPPNVSGASFDPPVTQQPSIHRAYHIDGDNIYDISELISGFVKNGIYYDVVLTEITEEYPNVKISII